MTPARACRQILFTLLLCVFLRACVPWFQEDTDLDAQSLPTPTITVSVTPHIQGMGAGQKTATITIRVGVPQNPQNRVVCVVVDGTIYRSSCWESLATEAPRKEFAYTGLSAGEYVVIAELQWVEEGSGKRKTSQARDQFIIVDGAGEGE